MPFLGLLDRDGREISAAGYHRLDASAYNFRLSPPQSNTSDHMVVINSESISFPIAGSHWKPWALALYDEVDSADPQLTVILDSLDIRHGDQLVIFPGRFRLGWRGFRDRDNELSPDRLDRLVNALRVARDALHSKSPAYKVVCEALDEASVDER